MGMFSLLSAEQVMAASPSTEKEKVKSEVETPHLSHGRHLHRHGNPHKTMQPSTQRFFTTRSSEIVLPLPSEEDAFTFAVFGDRTGGQPEGVDVLADAVRDINLIEPDLVMTVGDLINGYNQTAEWLIQMREFKAIMNRLLCPWFPVAGNHGRNSPRSLGTTNASRAFPMLCGSSAAPIPASNGLALPEWCSTLGPDQRWGTPAKPLAKDIPGRSYQNGVGYRRPHSRPPAHPSNGP